MCGHFHRGQDYIARPLGHTLNSTDQHIKGPVRFEISPISRLVAQCP